MLLKPNQFAAMPVRSDCKLVHLDCHLSGQWIKEQENMFRVILFHNASNIVILLVQLKQKNNHIHPGEQTYSPGELSFV